MAGYPNLSCNYVSAILDNDQCWRRLHRFFRWLGRYFIRGWPWASSRWTWYTNLAQSHHCKWNRRRDPNSRHICSYHIRHVFHAFPSRRFGIHGKSGFRNGQIHAMGGIARQIFRSNAGGLRLQCASHHGNSYLREQAR